MTACLLVAVSLVAIAGGLLLFLGGGFVFIMTGQPASALAWLAGLLLLLAARAVLDGLDS